MAFKDARKISKFVFFCKQDLTYGSPDYISAKIATKYLTSKFCWLISYFVIIICFVFRCCSSFSNSGGSVSILVLPLCFMLSSQLLVQEKAEVAQGFVARHLEFQLVRELKTFTHIGRGKTASLQILSEFCCNFEP